MAGLQGKVFDGYQLTEQLNGGSIAEVYRARPTNQGGREAIVKVIHPEFAQQKGFLPHFREIVKLSKRLANHPHILPLLASGEDKGYLYLITPYVAAGTLKDWIARGERLGAADAGPFFHQLCDALGYAHSLGIVHSNIKPSNIFLFEGRHVLLGDFGMLLDIGMLREFAQMDARHSAEAVEYMAPEMANSSATQLSDIYSVGAVLFAAIAGQPPFRGATLGEVLTAHERLPVPHLQQVTNSLIPAMQALDVVTQRALAKRPEDRFPAAAALTQAIDATLRQVAAQAPQAALMQPAPQMPITPLGQVSPMAAWPQGGVGAVPPGTFGVPQPLPGAVSGLGAIAGAGIGATVAASGQILPALNPPFPPLPPSATVDETMEHGRVNYTTEGPTAQVPAPQPGKNKPAPNVPEIQSTMRIPAPQIAVGMEQGVANPRGGQGGQPIGNVAGAVNSAWLNSGAAGNGAPVANPTSLPGYQQGAGWSGNSGGASGKMGDAHPQQMPVINGMSAASTSAPSFAPANGNQWTDDNADEDAAGWDKLNSQRYASINTGGTGITGDYGSQGAEDPWPEYTNESAAYSAVRDNTSDYQASDTWNEGYSGKYAGTSVSDDSQRLESWSPQESYQSERSDGRSFSPTQLGLPRLTSPALGTDLPAAWQDIIGGTMPQDSRDYSAEFNGAGWNDVSGMSGPLGGAAAQSYPYNDDASGYSAASMASMAPIAAADPLNALWPDPAQNGGRRGMASHIPLEEQQVWTTGTTAVRPQSRLVRWLVPLILIMIIVDLGIIAVGRPDLCPSNSCQAISAKAHQVLPFLNGGNTQVSSALNTQPTIVTLTVATNKTATTTLKLTNTGPNTTTWKASSGFAWLTLTVATGTLKANSSIALTLTATPTSIHTGSYTAAITITGVNQVLTIPVTITVTN